MDPTERILSILEMRNYWTKECHLLVGTLAMYNQKAYSIAFH